ncbi:hypothetical protein [Cellulophaga omnivescoria]|uniref:hypothetical protein n=1 Tax=Cellulophaga omnivescoria TaxID=1888890 RepID=UPI0022F0D939|nr:hypothetical protein [Cellulophaga omnivescoria]WBU89063.1 hypothetical protein PBN93_14455 [Cellulophaga omnivescoria]WKB81037.1 hypothetical protein QYR09_14930 [Cellulophaga lytica]
MRLKLTTILFLICGLLLAQDKETFTGSEDNVEYKAIFDGKDVYLTLRTEFKETMLSMLHRGYTIYFDTKGKKKKNVSIQYPLKTELPEKGARPERDERKENRENSDQKGPDIAKMIENLPKKANYSYFDSSEDFNLDMNNLGIVMNYNYYNTKEKGAVLEYHLKIPASKISSETGNLSKLSIGIVSTKQEQKNNQQKPNISMGGRQGGGGQGGPPGGGRSGGAGRGISGGRPPQADTNSQVEKIDFWFKLYPKKNK